MSTFTYKFDSQSFKGTTSVNTGLFIDNEWVAPIKPELIDVINPATSRLLTKVSVGSSEDVDNAVRAARKAFKTTWGLNAPGTQRAALLNKLADLIEQNIDEIAALESLGAGIPYTISKPGFVGGAVQKLRYYAGWAGKSHGNTIETNPAKFAYTRREPIGVCAQITAWNVPLAMFIGKLAPALACGCTCVIKPSEVTPLSTLRVCELIKQAGFPPGVVNVVVGYGATVGKALSYHMDINKISFTGSTAVGRLIAKAAAESNLKRVTLELGGKSPNVICDDADLTQAVKWAEKGLFGNAGQACSAGSRIFVQEGIYDEFITKFTAAAKARKLGDPMDPSTAQGPQISEIHFNRVMSYIASGQEEGATLSVGGSRHGTEGFFIQPTVFTDVKSTMRIVQEEIFGPVGVVVKFKTDEEVIGLANDTSYGLAAAVFTSNINRAIKISNSIEAGTVFVNCYNWLDEGLPWSGFKQSGWGCENGEEVLNLYTELKAVHINIGFQL